MLFVLMTQFAITTQKLASTLSEWMGMAVFQFEEHSLFIAFFVIGILNFIILDISYSEGFLRIVGCFTASLFSVTCHP